MKTRALWLTAALWVLGCAGTHRPSVVTSPPTDANAKDRVPTGTATPEPGQHVDSGPDVRPLQEDAAAGADIVGGENGEGGPLADIPFDYNEATLTDETKALLGRHAEWLKQHGQLKVIVEGHCDQRGTVEYNLALGDQRAQAVRDHLLSLGVATERMTTVSYGKERPIDPGSSEGAWAKNRRAHFVVTR